MWHDIGRAAWPSPVSAGADACVANGWSSPFACSCPRGVRGLGLSSCIRGLKEPSRIGVGSWRCWTCWVAAVGVGGRQCRRCVLGLSSRCRFRFGVEPFGLAGVAAAAVRLCLVEVGSRVRYRGLLGAGFGVEQGGSFGVVSAVGRFRLVGAGPWVQGCGFLRAGAGARQRGLFGGVGGSVGGGAGRVEGAVCGWAVDLPAVVVDLVVASPAGEHQVVQFGGAAL